VHPPPHDRGHVLAPNGGPILAHQIERLRRPTQLRRIVDLNVEGPSAVRLGRARRSVILLRSGSPCVRA
jgi:hypothetical protein